MTRPIPRFGLSAAPDGLGLNCDGTGLTLAGVALLCKDDNGFSPRAPEEIAVLVRQGYGEGRGPAVPSTSALASVADALNRGDLAKAAMTAVFLKLPDLDADGAVRMILADDALAKYSPAQPRDWHGRWTAGNKGAPTAHIAMAHVVKPASGKAGTKPSTPAAQSTAGKPSAAAAALSFALAHIDDGAVSPYGLFGLNPEASGRIREPTGTHGSGAPKCNIFVHDAYAAAGAAPKLSNGAIPRAEDWGNDKVPIFAPNGASFKVVLKGQLTDLDLSRLQPGDIISNGHHMGIYAPLIYTAGEKDVPTSYAPNHSPMEVVDTGMNSALPSGAREISPRTISAAAVTDMNIFAPTKETPWLGGVTWNDWAFRRDSEHDEFVVRRLTKP